MPIISCFRGSKSDRNGHNGVDQAPRPVVLPTRSKKSSFRRQDSHQAPSRTSSNSSIAQLPPCKRESDHRIDAMMMPVPEEGRQSRCLRLSHPRIYGEIVSEMKSAKGCRNWKDFAVFYDDDVNEKISADQFARKKASDYEKRLEQFGSFSSNEEFDPSMDTIG